jgi:hypothetical protein
MGNRLEQSNRAHQERITSHPGGAVETTRENAEPSSNGFLRGNRGSSDGIGRFECQALDEWRVALFEESQVVGVEEISEHSRWSASSRPRRISSR